MNKSDKDNTTPHKAANYDVEVRRTVPFYDHFYNQTIDLVKSVKPDARIWLDTGCGTGWLVSEAYVHFSHTHFVLVDPSRSMLDEAKTKLATLQQDRIRFLPPVGTQDIELADDTTPDVITAIQCHHYLDVETRRIAAKKCYDMLADGGLYVTFENIHPNTNMGLNIGHERWQNYQRAQGRDEESVQYHRTRFNSEYFPISVSDHLDLLTACGFRDVELLWYSNMQAGFYAIK
ncbi:MAG: class I SAM-dependent methyltransferase [Chloroflexi bacterium]|jgi:tRNA (cmo5U34)-methyltransferase|nr:class I SAM-dependent methyltransferase [Chloroflexota bacterium]MBT7081217.1 class I SAM-dependent methyltransferase [Chloroflexota bacterium]MBT7290307.1 class I SAM-dependent methyltransferase [Chloroflexota bacterium]